MSDPIGGKDFLVKGLFTAGDTLTAQRLKREDTTFNQVKNINKISQLDSNTSKQQRFEEASKAATDFEALLLHQMLNSMWSTVPKGGTLSGSREEELFRDMLTQTLAENIAQNQSLGIKEAVMKDMGKGDTE